MHRILSVHNHYRQPGGEDQAFTAEASLLRENGHPVSLYEEQNDRIGNGLLTGVSVVWNQNSYRKLQALVRRNDIGLVHFHNTFPLVSPSAYYAVRKPGVAVVQTLHNYRLLCPSATLYRSGAVCEECIERRSHGPAVVHNCYRGSRLATAAVATMLGVHRAAGTWSRAVDIYIALSEFARGKFIQGGIPIDRIAVKPNFVTPDPGIGEGAGDYALFVGRLAPEKGIETLARAWQNLQDIPLKVVGDGPLSRGSWPPGTTLMGHQPRDRVLALMRAARVLVFPSLWYECAPMTILEASACGLPVIASDLGSLPEFVTDHRTGLLFRPGDSTDLATKVRWAFQHPEQLREMRAEARREYESKYTAERNYRMLSAIYDLAIDSTRVRRGAQSADGLTQVSNVRM